MDTLRLREQQSQQAAGYGHQADKDLGEGGPHVLQQQDERSDSHSNTSHGVVVAEGILPGGVEKEKAGERTDNMELTLKKKVLAIT